MCKVCQIFDSQKITQSVPPMGDFCDYFGENSKDCITTDSSMVNVPENTLQPVSFFFSLSYS